MTKKNKLFLYGELLISSTGGKFFSLIAKIALTNILGIKVMAIYGLINPLLVLVITLSSFSLPNILSYLISSNPNKTIKYMQTAFIIMIFFSVILAMILYFFSTYIGITFFHNKDVIPSIKMLSFLVPLISISSLIKGYFYGVREVNFTTSSQLFEEGFRMLFCLFIVSYLCGFNDAKNASIIVISLCIGEIFQSLYLLIFANKKYQKNYLKMFVKIDSFFIQSSKEMISLALPMTLSRLIGSITYFLEPIILTTMLIKINYSIDLITYEYGILTTYVMPLLLLPGFFSLSLSNYLLPNLTFFIKNNDYHKAKSIFKNIVIYCFLIGLFFSILFFFFGGNILKILYGNDIGKSQIKYLAFPFLLYYFEAPLSAAMNAFCLTKVSFLTSIISSTIRIILLFILIPLYKVNAVSIATIASCLITIITYGYHIRKSFLFNKNKSAIN